jgi:hypothetical protein
VARTDGHVEGREHSAKPNGLGLVVDLQKALQPTIVVDDVVIAEDVMESARIALYQSRKVVFLAPVRAHSARVCPDLDPSVLRGAVGQQSPDAGVCAAIVDQDHACEIG